ncbi:hypothetical protein [Streptomyces sp. Wb2n-11]|uniref:hypothetical protein n=1 Tax=Streptomyces sp. Wb2n-11 TaxID=1030533 RepID=UPI00114652EA|nr:hypothetical protein [Streptomyces sp. Wb2n-11]
MIKGLLMPFTFALAVLAGADVGGHTLLRALVVWAALELLIYPARYQWNDVRGFVADQQHPAKGARGRLPGPIESARPHVLASCTVAVGRLAVAASLALAWPALHLGPVLAAVTAGVFSTAVLYETLRAKCTGRSGEVPSPLRPAVIALWIVVGAGYAVRGMAGFALAVDLGEDPALGVVAAVALWAFGIAFVTSRWALEATAFASADRGQLTWSARPEHAREHLLALVRWLPRRIDVPAPADWTPLREHTSTAAPWNAALLVAGTGAALTGSLLTTPGAPTSAAVATALGALATAAAVLLPQRRPLIVLAGAAVQWAVPVLRHEPHPLAALLPWLSVMTAYLVFSSRSLNTIGALSRRLSSACAVLLGSIARGVLGPATWSAVRKEPGESLGEPR